MKIPRLRIPLLFFLGMLVTHQVTAQVFDGGFEQSTGPDTNPYWTVLSGEPFCSINPGSAQCLTGGPRSGDWWARFPFQDSVVSFEQVVTIPPGQARIDLYLRIFLRSGNSDDVLFFWIDNDDAINRFTLATGADDVTQGYDRHTRDLTPWADGAQHLIHFEARAPAVLPTVFFVDDISVEQTGCCQFGTFGDPTCEAPMTESECLGQIGAVSWTSGVACLATGECQPTLITVPTLTPGGLVAMALILLAAGFWMVHRHRLR